MDIASLNSINDTKRHIGLGLTKIYELIGLGALDARKAGSKTLITGDSIKAYIASLPAAQVGVRGGHQTSAKEEHRSPPGHLSPGPAGDGHRSHPSRREDCAT